MSKLGHQKQIRLDLIRAPHVTEKSAASGSASTAYVFKVAIGADKVSLRRAITEAYKVTPRQINIVNVPAKKVLARGRVGHKSGFKKAVVYLKPGEKIELA